MLAQDTRNPELQVLRAIAICCVFVANIPLNLFFWRSSLGLFEDAYWSGNCGIDLFLAISGAVVVASYRARLGACTTPAETMTVVTQAYLRRFWHVTPSLLAWIVIALVLCVTFNATGAFHGFDADLGAGETSLLGVNNLWFGAVAGVSDTSVLFAWWPISLDQQFYILLPAVIVFRPKALVPLAAVAILWQFIMPQGELVMRTGALGAGTLVAVWRPHLAGAHPRGRQPAWRFAVLVLAILLLGALQSGLAVAMRPYANGLVAVGSGAVVCAASLERGYLALDGAAGRIAAYLGDRALAIGLVHVPMFALVRESYARLLPPPLVITTGLAAMLVLAALAATLLAAEATYRLVERPCRAYGAGIVPGRAAQAPA